MTTEYDSLAFKKDPQAPTIMHVLICDPRIGEITEAFQRQADNAWIIRRFRAPSRERIDRMRSPTMLGAVGMVIEQRDLSQVAEPLGTIAALIEDLAEVLR